MKIKLLKTPEYKSGSARAKWFAAVKRHDGKTVEAFTKNTTKRLPTKEASAGWLRYFEREGVINIH